MLLKGKVVVITGGSGLLGQEFVKTVVKEGGIGIIADIDEKCGQKTSKSIQTQLNSKNVVFLKFNTTSKKSIDSLIQKVHTKYGRIDALVNNAYPRNKNYGKHFFDVEYEDFVENLGANLGGYFLSSQLFAKYFQKQKYGNIINMSSIYGVATPRFDIYEGTGMTTPVEYVAIKSGLLQLTKYMAKYFKGMNIRVNAISPGGVLDNQPKEFLKNYNQQCSIKGMLRKQDLNGTLLYLLSDMSQYVNGQNVIVDDGFTL
ncbi:SDR family oxidoreductase [bacterium]|jgi:NAD(P)-dependent dehydrogenase (short-subunit alcohol dehydrogenase family)|nr:SDR family oxidoreductase [bacterium]